MYKHVKVPAGGAKITVNKDYSLNVPDNPIIPYIEGDGTGFDITPVMIKVVDAAVAKAYGGKRKIHWMEIYAGEKSTKVYGPDVWLPDETLAILKDYVVSIKGPLTTPVGGGIRSLNVALRQELDLAEVVRAVALDLSPLIAERDLEIRGPGEFLGARQSGAALLRFANLDEDAELLAWARDAAPRLLDRSPELAHQHVARWLGAKAEFLKA